MLIEPFYAMVLGGSSLLGYFFKLGTSTDAEAMTTVRVKPKLAALPSRFAFDDFLDLLSLVPGERRSLSLMGNAREALCFQRHSGAPPCWGALRIRRREEAYHGSLRHRPRQA